MDQVRQLFQLLAESLEIKDATEGTRHAMRGACTLVGAQVGVLANIHHFTVRGGGQVQSVIDVGWDNATQCTSATAPYVTIGCVADPFARSIMKIIPPRGTVTLRRSDVLRNRIWYSSEFFIEARRAAGFDHLIHSIRYVAGARRVEGISWLRPFGERDFKGSELALTQLFHEQVLRQSRVRSVARERRLEARLEAFGLSPRERQTALLLTSGLSQKEAAASLRISPHTFHQYVRAVYHKLNVGSRAALNALLSQ